jgi:HD-GYP domain-containing protein (c-di-GMP phosphodiesterase class II)
MLHHHERYDGKGYPHGLKGKDIPLEARIIAVADTFDAITSDRAYRPAKSPEEALKEIEKVAGTQLDPELVKVFKKVCKEDLGLEA